MSWMAVRWRKAFPCRLPQPPNATGEDSRRGCEPSRAHNSAGLLISFGAERKKLPAMREGTSQWLANVKAPTSSSGEVTLLLRVLKEAQAAFSEAAGDGERFAQVVSERVA